MAIIEGAIPRDAVKVARAAGAAAGNHTVTGIKARDKLVSVLHLDATDASETLDDLTPEFSISAVDTINNTGGTDTSGGFLIVIYLSVG
ncbi:MAG: hypothetical protein NOU37_09240 [Candidatus Brocadiales bacterium]|nr:hypothetical protein [Candidatus Bathyanammoxibius amoris]